MLSTRAAKLRVTGITVVTLAMGAGLTIFGVSGPANAAESGGAHDTHLEAPGLIDVNCSPAGPRQPQTRMIHLEDGYATRTEVFNGPSSWHVGYTSTLIAGALEPDPGTHPPEYLLKTFSSEADYNAFMNDVGGNADKICSNMVGLEYGEIAPIP